MLETGTVIPELSLEDTTGQPIHLAEFRDTANILMYFMRSTTCPVCNRHVKDLAAQAAELSHRHVRILVAVPEGRAEAKSWKVKKNVPLTVVTGRGGTPHEAVGAHRKIFGAMQQSGSILIDTSGVIRHSHASTMPVSSYDKKGILSAVDSLPLPRSR